MQFMLSTMLQWYLFLNIFMDYLQPGNVHRDGSIACLRQPSMTGAILEHHNIKVTFVREMINQIIQYDEMLDQDFRFVILFFCLGIRVNRVFLFKKASSRNYPGQRLEVSKYVL